MMQEQVPDRPTRRLLAFRARQLVTCRLSAGEFDFLLLDTEHPFYTSQDPAVFEVSDGGFRGLYDDYRTTYLTDQWALSREERRTVARWMLYLYTDLPYEWWEPQMSLGMRLRKFLRNLTGGHLQYEEPVVAETGDKDVWPFFRRADYEAALKRPPLLCGK